MYNKIDAVSIELVDKLAREPHSCVISALSNLNIDESYGLLDRIWDELNMIRVYTKKRGHKPVRSSTPNPTFVTVWPLTIYASQDFSDPLVLKTDSTVEDAARLVHKSLVMHFKYALVWGKSSKVCRASFAPYCFTP